MAAGRSTPLGPLLFFAIVAGWLVISKGAVAVQSVGGAWGQPWKSGGICSD